MDFEKLSDRLKGFLQSAQTLAVREGNPQITPEHLLKVLLDDPRGSRAASIARAGGNAKQALQATEAALGKLPKVSGSGATQPHMAAALARVVDQAEQIATKAGDQFVTVERLLLALGLSQGGRGRAHPLRRRVDAADPQRRDQRSAQGPHRG